MGVARGRRGGSRVGHGGCLGADGSKPRRNAPADDCGGRAGRDSQGRTGAGHLADRAGAVSGGGSEGGYGGVFDPQRCRNVGTAPAPGPGALRGRRGHRAGLDSSQGVRRGGAGAVGRAASHLGTDGPPAAVAAPARGGPGCISAPTRPVARAASDAAGRLQTIASVVGLVAYLAYEPVARPTRAPAPKLCPSYRLTNL